MMWLILLVALVGAAIVAGFAYLLLGWVGLTFAIIATVGGGAVVWYGYVLYGKASDLAHEGSVVAKRLGEIGELLGQIKVPDGTELAVVRENTGVDVTGEHNA